ncbi:hypothetical protein PSECIP111951_01356 [Pseudoalteromonas holothuriae]|uniref:HTH araC/xylS-type domain-containing protein n=1 Tax=Pseudoalteromonas holothuriae TaxID=2963714 RepID=A0ABM9GIJ5_9GAMM|nr:AraC family transcriptional regulator [Pseudoalteromonas sp. CIP111951]CAH9055958.1 hypothetical protein PSECIP111951_01356 [Pseudoalteromonas sp. CIP111951]
MNIEANNLFEILFSALSLGVGGFAIHSIAVKLKQQLFYTPLLILLISLSVISSSGIVFFIFEQYILIYIALLAPCFLVLSPSLWLYTGALVADEPWQFKGVYIKHYVPAFISLVLSATLLLTPASVTQHMFFSNDEVSSTPLTLFISISIMITLTVWFIQTIYYLYHLVALTIKYHKQLKNIFSDLTHKKIKWLIYITMLLVINWLWGGLSLLLDNSHMRIFEPHWGQALCLITIWGLGFFGLQQQPGFVTTYDTAKPKGVNTQKPTEVAPYQRSALSDKNANKIADKIKHALEHEQVYLDPHLNLFKLAKHLNEPSQYVSQTLSQVMQTSFFECINHARIEAAKVKLLEGQSNVLEIAMSVGFNARSSFYKAFKNVTGQTPSQFQKKHSP